MSNAIYKKDLHDVALAVAQGSKDYTDKTKEEIYWHIGDYSVSTQPDNTTASTKTVPTGATRCKIKHIYGLTEKFNPSVAYDNASTMTKTMPNVVYDFDCSVVYGASEVSVNKYTVNPQPMITLIAGSNKWIGLDDIPIVNGKTYTIKFFNTRVANEVVQLVNYSYTTINYTQPYTFTANTDFVRIRIGNGDLSGDINYQLKMMIVEGSDAPTEFSVGFTGIRNLELTGLKVETGNICNYDEFLANQYTIASDGSYTSDNTRGCTNYLEVKSSDYKVSFDAQVVFIDVAYYDENKTYMSRNIMNNSKELNLSVPSNAKYLRFSFQYQYTTPLSTTILNNIKPTLTYVSQTLPIDLTSIEDSGGNKLFEDGSLKGVGTAKDYITPYVAHKELSFTEITSNSSYTWISGTYLYATLNVNGLFKQGGALLYTGNDNIVDAVYASNGNIMFTFGTAYSSQQELKNAMVGVQLIYELATPIEVSIDWSSTLRGIQGYSNGTISLLNTYNMDTANTITYNSIIKENCCAKIVQSRGGSVVKTINLPTVASDGYSAGSVNNVRDFTTNKRGTNVNKNSNLGGLTWDISVQGFFRSSIINNMKAGQDANVGNILTNKYITYKYNDLLRNNEGIALGDNSRFYVNDTSFNQDAQAFKTAMANEPFYYELADASKTETSIDSVDNIIEVQPNDVLSFYDNNDNLVTVPSDLTYRIEVERV